MRIIPTRIAPLACLLLTSALLLPAVASADIVRPREEPCPAGSTLQTRHGGQWCNPTTCSAEQPCEAGRTCTEAVGLCVQTHTHRSGRRGSGAEYTQDEAEGVCATDADCAVGKCVVAARCTEAAAPPEATAAPTPAPTVAEPEAGDEPGGVCALAPAAVGPLALLLVGALVPRRRRG